MEATLLGYDLSQEISETGRNLNISNREALGRGTLDLLEDPNYRQDYNLGKIGNRSFCDAYGIWSNRPQEFPTPCQGAELQPQSFEERQEEYGAEVKVSFENPVCEPMVSRGNVEGGGTAPIHLRAKKEGALGLHGLAGQAWKAYKRDVSTKGLDFDEESSDPTVQLRLRTMDYPSSDEGARICCTEGSPHRPPGPSWISV